MCRGAPYLNLKLVCQSAITWGPAEHAGVPLRLPSEPPMSRFGLPSGLAVKCKKKTHNLNLSEGPSVATEDPPGRALSKHPGPGPGSPLPAYHPPKFHKNPRHFPGPRWVATPPPVAALATLGLVDRDPRTVTPRTPRSRACS